MSRACDRGIRGLAQRLRGRRISRHRQSIRTDVGRARAWAEGNRRRAHCNRLIRLLQDGWDTDAHHEADRSWSVAYDKDLAERVRHALASADADPERAVYVWRPGVHGPWPHDRRSARRRPHRAGWSACVRRRADASVSSAHGVHGKPMTGMVFVAGPNLDDASLDAWVHRGLEFTASLPPK